MIIIKSHYFFVSLFVEICPVFGNDDDVELSLVALVTFDLDFSSCSTFCHPKKRNTNEKVIPFLKI